MTVMKFVNESTNISTLNRMNSESKKKKETKQKTHFFFNMP